MMRWLVSLAATLVLPLMIYAVGAFSLWQFDPSLWTAEQRAPVAVLGFLFGPFVGLMVAVFPGWDDRK